MAAKRVQDAPTHDLVEVVVFGDVVEGPNHLGFVVPPLAVEVGLALRAFQLGLQLVDGLVAFLDLFSRVLQQLDQLLLRKLLGAVQPVVGTIRQGCGKLCFRDKQLPFIVGFIVPLLLCGLVGPWLQLFTGSATGAFEASVCVSLSGGICLLLFLHLFLIM